MAFAKSGVSRWRETHPMAALVIRRAAAGAATLLAVSVLVFVATAVLPGNAAYAVLGHTATPERLRALEHRLHLDESLPHQYWTWLSGLCTGNLGDSLANGDSVWHLMSSRLENSAVLVLLAGVIGTAVGATLGAIAALRRDTRFDHFTSALLLAMTSLPEFVVGIGLIIVFSTGVSHVLPAVSAIPPGASAWSQPSLLVLPVMTLVIVTVPYIFRMMRAAMVEALDSDYLEMARLKGLPASRLVIVHALPNAIPPTIQVVGLCFLYLAGGIVIVEQLFNYPGVGQGLVDAISARDIPVIQFTVVVLGASYVIINIATDVIALLATPRRRFAR
jgi:peptide/nickel transport system permease protein